jgi:hypothetical protein
LRIASAEKERREGEPTRCGGRCAAQTLLSRSCCNRPVSLPFFRFLQSTEHRDFSSKQFSFFAQQLFRESPSRALGGSASGGFLPFLRNDFFFGVGSASAGALLSFFFCFFLILLFFFWREGGIFVDGVNVCVPLDCVE